MFTLLTTLISFLAGNTPKFLEFFQDRSDKKHELELAQLQMQQQLALQQAGFVAQKDLEEVKVDELKIQTDADKYQAKISDINSARLNDIETSRGASAWVINIRALVRPAITFGLFAIFLFIELWGCWYAYYNRVDYKVALELLWDNETQIIWASIVGFYFGTR
jgi:hypothetical protein